jgi:hypothetical protein
VLRKLATHDAESITQTAYPETLKISDGRSQTATDLQQPSIASQFQRMESFNKNKKLLKLGSKEDFTGLWRPQLDLMDHIDAENKDLLMVKESFAYEPTQ